jgi:hypothetical protein
VLATDFADAEACRDALYRQYLIWQARFLE